MPLQTFLDFNAVYILIESSRAHAAVPLLYIAEPSLSVVELQSSLIQTGVPGSGRNWVLGVVAYIACLVACWILWIFGVFLGYDVLIIVVGASVSD